MSTADAARAARPSPLRRLGRGLTKRCAVCGAGHLFEGWFRMKDRCPGCGYRFEREEGFFLGAYVVNLAVAEAIIICLTIVPLIYLSATRPEASIWPIVIFGGIGVVVGPLLFYPFSRTVWVAIELILRPPEAVEPTDNR